MTKKTIYLNLDAEIDGTVDKLFKNETQIEAIDYAIDDLKKQRENLIKANEALENQMTASIDKAGLKSLTTKRYHLTPRNYTPKLVIDQKGQIPSKYLKQVVKTTIDKNAIKRDLKDGITVAGVHLDPIRKTKIVSINNK